MPEHVRPMWADLGLEEYGTWWRDQIGALLDRALPPRWRPVPRPVRAVTFDADGRLRVPPPPDASANAPVVLFLPRGWLLVRDVSLPGAVGRDLAAAVGFEMDRLTPFKADEVFWSVRSTRRDPARGLVIARLALIPRARIEPALAELATAGWSPDALSDGSDEITMAGGLLRRRREHQRIGVLAAACVALAMLAAAVPFVKLSRQTDAVEAGIAALQPRADAAQRLRNQLARRSTAAAAFAHARQTTGDALAAIAAVTRALPDDTNLTSLGVHQMQLTFDGQSTAAAKLIGRIAADPALREPSFAAPVTSTGSRDLFSIHATLAPPADAAKVSAPPIRTHRGSPTSSAP